MKEKPCADCGASFVGRRSRCSPCYGKYRWARAPVKYDSARDLPRNRRHFLKTRYGLTEEAYEKILAEQNGRCALCGTDKCLTGRNFAVDHDHTSGQVRALLCIKCNTGLGKFRDSPDLLRKAAEYLEFHRASTQTPS